MTSLYDRPNTALIARDTGGWHVVPGLPRPVHVGVGDDRVVVESAAVDVATQGVRS